MPLFAALKRLHTGVLRNQKKIDRLLLFICFGRSWREWRRAVLGGLRKKWFGFGGIPMASERMGKTGIGGFVFTSSVHIDGILCVHCSSSECAYWRHLFLGERSKAEGRERRRRRRPEDSVNCMETY